MFCEKFRWIFNNGINDLSRTMLYSHCMLNDNATMARQESNLNGCWRKLETMVDSLSQFIIKIFLKLDFTKA